MRSCSSLLLCTDSASLKQKVGITMDRMYTEGELQFHLNAEKLKADARVKGVASKMKKVVSLELEGIQDVLDALHGNVTPYTMGIAIANIQERLNRAFDLIDEM